MQFLILSIESTDYNKFITQRVDHIYNEKNIHTQRYYSL